MPYVSYAKISDDDVKALYAYFKYGVAPVSQAQKPGDIPWPLNVRWPLAVWNWMFLKEGPYQAKSNQTIAWNRGAYLAQGLAHCSTCHTPRGFGMQEKALDDTGSGFLSGSILANWESYNITSDANSGIGRWTQSQLVQYLRTGSVPGLAQAAGPMGEAVQHSFSQMNSSDIEAMATYIRTVPAVSNADSRSRSAWGAPAVDVTRLRGVALSEELDAARLYLGNCATCHQAHGEGTPDGYYPSLFHNSVVGAPNPVTLVQVILHGVHRNAGGKDVAMPAFANELTDEEIMVLTNYVLAHFGNPAVLVLSERDVARLRSRSDVGECIAARVRRRGA